mmetsp:Transcript_15867/g.47606  ORF Transcript_15867/g.47606 Transcript_15867/m.47606 type:complete len:314 (+) Transcript_15867:1667-2608(+)
MESESLPPSMAMPSSMHMAQMASAASYIFGPSPSSFAAHIQLPEALMDSSEGIATHMRLVMDSAIARRAMALLSSGLPRRPFMGASPRAVTPPVLPIMLWAIMARFASGVCSGPTHCCCATRPVTERSTLFVRKRFEPTDTRRSTPMVSAVSTRRPAGRASSFFGVTTRVMGKTFCGILPSTRSSGRSTGTLLSRVSLTITRPSPVTLPMTAYGARSRLQMPSQSGRSFSSMRRQSFSWNSAVQSSRRVIEGSPTSILRMSISAPAGSEISFSTLPEPPAPWSWMDRMGFLGPSSTQARMTRLTRCSISASPR